MPMPKKNRISLIDITQNKFDSAKDEIFTKYKGKFIIFSIKGIEGVFDTPEEANEFAIRNFRMGSYLLIDCHNNSY